MLLLKGKFEGFKRLKTKINLIFSVESVDELQLLQLEKTQGHIAFSGDVLKKKVEEAMKNSKIGITENGRTRSQIFRGVCFRIAEEHGFDAEEFYNQEMDKIIQHYKKKL